MQNRRFMYNFKNGIYFQQGSTQRTILSSQTSQIWPGQIKKIHTCHSGRAAKKVIKIDGITKSNRNFVADLKILAF